MAKPYAGYKGNNLVDIIPRAIAFVTEGANKRRFFLFKHKPQGDISMDKKLAISLIKSGNLTHEQVEAIVNAVDEDDRADVLAVAKSKDPEGSAFSSFVKEFLPQIIKAEVKKALKKHGMPGEPGASGESGTSGASGDSGASGASGESDSTAKEILSKLNDILDDQESKDDELQKCIKEEEENPGIPNYAELKKKWEEGTLDDSEAKEYMKAKTSIRTKARKALKAYKLKAEKDAINELTSEEGKKNQEGNMGSSGFDKNIKKIFEDDREITDPAEIEKLASIAQAGVEAGVL